MICNSRGNSSTHSSRGSIGGQVTTDSSYLRIIHDLVAAAQADEPNAIEDLISQLRPAMFNYCRSRLGRYPGGVEAADDVVQETCIAVCKIVPKYRDEGLPFTALVYAIASNKVADAMRGYSRSAVLVEEFPEQTEPSPGPEERVMISANVRAAHQLIDRLPRKMRDILLLRARGVSADHVADQLGMTPGAVRVTHHRAVAKLRQLMEESEEHQQLFSGGRLAAAV